MDAEEVAIIRKRRARKIISRALGHKVRGRLSECEPALDWPASYGQLSDLVEIPTENAEWESGYLAHAPSPYGYRGLGYAARGMAISIKDWRKGKIAQKPIGYY